MESTEKKVKEEEIHDDVEEVNGTQIGGERNLRHQLPASDPSSHLPPPHAIRSKFPTSTATATAGASAPNVPPPAQLTIFYGGTVCVFDAVSAEKAQSIMVMAAAAAAAKASADNNTNDTNTKNGVVPSTPASPVLTRSPSLQSTAAVEVSGISRPHSVASPSFCKLQPDLPIARRHSLQRFLEKRRDRLVSKSPYPPGTPTKPTETPEGGLSETAKLLC